MREKIDYQKLIVEIHYSKVHGISTTFSMPKSKRILQNNIVSAYYENLMKLCSKKGFILSIEAAEREERIKAQILSIEAAEREERIKAQKQGKV